MSEMLCQHCKLSKPWGHYDGGVGSELGANTVGYSRFKPAASGKQGLGVVDGGGGAGNEGGCLRYNMLLFAKRAGLKQGTLPSFMLAASTNALPQ